MCDKKENIMEIINLFIENSRLLTAITKITNGCDILHFDSFSIVYLMGFNINMLCNKRPNEADAVTEKYVNILECYNNDLTLSNNDAAHLIYSKLQDEINKDLEKYPYFKVK